MKLINRYRYLIALIVLAGFSSCSDYLDINESETATTQEVVSPDFLLGGAMVDMVSSGGVFLSGNEAGNVLMYNWGADIQNFSGGYTDEFSLTFTHGYRNSVWDNTYQDLITFQSIIDYESEIYDNFKAIARINKAFYFQYLVDLYGDIPYFEALQGGDNITPTYDDAQEIYRDLIVQLNLAIEEIKNADAQDVTPSAQDVVFDGDMSKWIQFANTLKLRILLRQSKLGGETQAYLNEQFAALENNFLTTTAGINPGYDYVSGKMNPLYANYGFDVEKLPVGNYLFNSATSYATLFMQGTETLSGVRTNVFDPRVNRIYQPLEGLGIVVGMQHGSVSSDPDTPEVISPIGPGIITPPELDGAAKKDMFLFTAAESYFLQAEAVARGYLSGNAETLFNNGIKASFERLGLAASDAQTYIDESHNTNLIGWDAAGSLEEKIETIMTQKWIALNGINGAEIWIEYTRTGYPDIPMSIVAQKPSRPIRLPYPQSEYSNNSANAIQQPISDIFTNPIFWDVD